jgi:hypothetical protein
VANYGKLSAYSCGGSCGIRAKTRHRIPFSLLIFEETVNSASLKGAGAGLVNGDAPPAIGLATAELQSIVPGVVGSRITSGTQDGNAVKNESSKAAAAPATVSGELPFTRSHWSHRSGKAEGTLRPASQ